MNGEIQRLENKLEHALVPDEYVDCVGTGKFIDKYKHDGIDAEVTVTFYLTHEQYIKYINREGDSFDK